MTNPVAPSDIPFIGTAGWAIPKAVVAAFPPSGPALSRYAARFQCVEINSTFYRSHRPSTYARWRDSVGPGFQFALKVPKSISHGKRLQNAALEFETFLAETDPLGDRRGPLLLQLPPKLEFDPMVADAFFRTARAMFDGPMAIEPRHPSWFGLESEAVLVAHAVSRVGADPPRGEAGNLPSGFRGLSYLRLHGAPRTYFSTYDTVSITSIASLLRNSPGRRWCIFDNTASGAATSNALQLQDTLHVVGPAAAEFAVGRRRHRTE